MDITYEEFIDNILKTRGRFACGNKYHERHHIVPKCIGGTNDKENLIDLFGREHFEAHRLLALENPKERGLQFAWFNMCQIKGRACQDRYIPTPEEYEEARVVVSRLNSGENNPFYGKHFSDDVKRKLSVSVKKRWQNPKNHPNYGKHLSENTRKKISQAHIGKPGVNRKKVICLTTGVIYESICEAQRQTGVASSNIANCCNGKPKYKSAGKHPETGEKLVWAYYI